MVSPVGVDSEEIVIARIHLITAGLCTLLVDHGRPRSRSLGVPVGGAADRTSLALGNALVGNSPDAPALEVCLSGPSLEADTDIACVLFGAPFDVNTSKQRLRAGKTFTLPAGEILSIGGTPSGMRAYLCIGGLSGPVILDSQSSLQPLSTSVELECQSRRIGSRFLASTLTWDDEPDRLRVLPGPQADWFDEAVINARRFIVSPASNRMGLRLQGEPLPVSGREMISEPVCPGSVQVTRNGQCIVLGVDGQTIGGYPKIAQVISADLDKLGQLRPGQSFEFRQVTMAEAEAIYRRKNVEMREWLLRLSL